MKFKHDKFAEHIKIVRELKNFDLRKAAKEIKISAATLNRAENGKVSELMTYAKICKWMNCSLDKFFVR